jgi:hypothetical protein
LHDVFVSDTHFFELPFGASFASDYVFSKVYELALLLHGTFSVGVAEGAIAVSLRWRRRAISNSA